MKIFILIVLILILIILLTFFIIYLKIKLEFNENGIDLNQAVSNSVNYEKDEYSRQKNVKGLTNMLEPVILQDFPEFNKELLYSLCENNLRKILECIEKQDCSEIKQDSDFIYLSDKLETKINDMKENNTYEKFDNIEFNKTAIYRYIKEKGKATIILSTSLSYFYDTNIKNRKIFTDLRKQTRYLVEFVYVYDESKFDTNQISFSIHCPNCGAPIKKLHIKYCEYCGNNIKPINLKIWKMSSYKEDC